MSADATGARWRRVAISIAVIGAIVSLAKVAAGVFETDALAAGFAFVGWAAMPAAACVLLALWLRSPRALRVHVAVTAMLIAFQLAVYLTEQFGRPDAQGALVYFFVPLYQLAALALAALGYGIGWLLRRTGAPRTTSL